jgi:hypothetical protein
MSSPAVSPDRRATGFAILRWIVGLVLMSAAILKAAHRVDVPLVPDRHLAIALIAAEWALGVWLIFGLAPRAAHVAALVAFAVFLNVSIHAWRSGYTSCTCFGNFSLHPKWMVLIDLLVIVLLVIFRPRVRAVSQAMWLRVTFVAVLVVSSAMLVGWLIRHPPPPIPQRVRPVVLFSGGPQGRVITAVFSADIQPRPAGGR